MPRSLPPAAPDSTDEREPYRLRAAAWPGSRRITPALGIAACLLSASLLSYARAWRAGTIKVDQSPLPGNESLWFTGALVACLAVAGWLHVRTCWSIRGGRLAALLPAAVLIQLAAALALPMTSNDIFSNLANGRLVLAGHNPYLEAPLAPGADHSTVVAGRRRVEKYFHALRPRDDGVCHGGRAGPFGLGSLDRVQVVDARLHARHRRGGLRLLSRLLAAAASGGGAGARRLESAARLGN